MIPAQMLNLSEHNFQSLPLIKYLTIGIQKKGDGLRTKQLCMLVVGQHDRCSLMRRSPAWQLSRTEASSPFYSANTPGFSMLSAEDLTFAKWRANGGSCLVMATYSR